MKAITAISLMFIALAASLGAQNYIGAFAINTTPPGAEVILYDTDQFLCNTPSPVYPVYADEYAEYRDGYLGRAITLILIRKGYLPKMTEIFVPLAFSDQAYAVANPIVYDIRLQRDLVSMYLTQVRLRRTSNYDYPAPAYYYPRPWYPYIDYNYTYPPPPYGTNPPGNYYPPTPPPSGGGHGGGNSGSHGGQGYIPNNPPGGSNPPGGGNPPNPPGGGNGGGNGGGGHGGGNGGGGNNPPNPPGGGTPPNPPEPPGGGSGGGNGGGGHGGGNGGGGSNPPNPPGGGTPPSPPGGGTPPNPPQNEQLTKPPNPGSGLSTDKEIVKDKIEKPPRK